MIKVKVSKFRKSVATFILATTLIYNVSKLYTYELLPAFFSTDPEFIFPLNGAFS